MKSRRPGSARRAFVALAALVLLSLPGRACAIDEQLLGALKRVQSVRIEGNSAVKEGAIKKVIKTGSGSFLGLRSLPLYRPDFLRSDVTTIQSLYARRGFLFAAVSAEADSGDQPGRVIVTYRIVEGRQVHVTQVSFDTTQGVPSARVHGAITLKAGEPYDPVQVVLDRTTIAEQFAECGFFPSMTTTTRFTPDSAGVAVHFGIVPGPGYRVRNVQITGVNEVDTAAVRREVLLGSGDLFQRERVIKSSERLYETGLFNSVQIEPVRVDTLLGQLDLLTRVRERKPRWVEGGVGAGSYEKFGVSAEWGHRNLTGRGRAISADASYGFYQQKDPYLARMRVALAYTEPWLFGVRVRGKIVPSYQRGFEVLGARTYTQNAWVLTFGLSRDFTYSQSRLSLTLDNTWTTDYEVVEDDGTDPSTFFIAPYVRSWTLAYDQDRRDDPIDPRRGGLTHLSSQLAGSTEGGQGRYVKFDAMSGGHAPRGRKGSVGARLRSAWIVGVGPGPQGDAGTIERVPVTDRLSIGGASSVRGYHENEIDDGGNGGRFLLNANLEWRFPVKGFLSGAFFLDGGNVWRKMDEVKLERIFGANGIDGTYGTADMRWAVGLGVRAHTPIGPLRLDYGRRLHTDEADLLAARTPQKDDWHFSIGQLF